MSSNEDDDEALTWAGGRDPSHYETPEEKAPRKRAKPTESTPAAASVDQSVASDELAQGMSAPVLISLGVLGGIYLLYTIGWTVSLGRFLYRFTTDLELIAFHTEQVLGILAAPLWFTVTVLLTRDRKPTVRLTWLLLGALLLVPWSFVFGL